MTGPGTTPEVQAAEVIRNALLLAFEEVTGYTSCLGCKQAHDLVGGWWDPGAQRSVIHEEDCPLRPFQEALIALETLA